MEELIKVFILGVVQGITEFLPISSTGHLLVASALLNSEVAERLGGTFEIFIQFGSVIAVVAYYRQDLWGQVTTVRQDRNIQRLWFFIVVAAVPAAVAGILLRDFIRETLFPQQNAPIVVATALITVGFVFLLVERRRNVDETALTELQNMTLRQAFLVGIAQMFALIPGVSRSGATIIGGLLSGMSRNAAITFSFYLAIPVLGGATLLDLLLSIDDMQSNDLAYLIVGTVISGIISWMAIDWLLRYVRSNNFTIFGVYRILAGLVILLLLAVNVLG